MSFNSSSSGMATPTPAGTELALVGFRFRPTDCELINNYLWPKNRGQDDHDPFIADVEVCKIEPWDLPVRSMIRSDDQVWYFYCRRELKFKKSSRSNRTTKEGYWKPDGKARPIKADCTKEVIGSKRTLVFHHGRPKGTRTKWVMHEYECSPYSELSNQGDFVLCKLKRDVYHQTALNPKIESHERAKMASLSSHEPSHLMLSGSYNKNQDLCITAARAELVDCSSVESSPTFDSNMGLLSMTNCLQTSSQKQRIWNSMCEERQDDYCNDNDLAHTGTGKEEETIGFVVKDAVLFPHEAERGMWPEDYSLSHHAQLTTVFSSIIIRCSAPANDARL